MHLRVVGVHRLHADQPRAGEPLGLGEQWPRVLERLQEPVVGQRVVVLRLVRLVIRGTMAGAPANAVLANALAAADTGRQGRPPQTAENPCSGPRLATDSYGPSRLNENQLF
jgi:hypothetical protein